MNSKIYFAWKGRVPPIQVICCPMPDTPELPLTGGGISKKPLETFLKDLEKDFQQEKGRYFAYVLDYYKSGDEADTYILETWQVCTPNDGTYEAIVILYYAALNPYQAIRKHMSKELADEYLGKSMALAAILEALN